MIARSKLDSWWIGYIARHSLCLLSACQIAHTQRVARLTSRRRCFWVVKHFVDYLERPWRRRRRVAPFKWQIWHQTWLKCILGYFFGILFVVFRFDSFLDSLRFAFWYFDRWSCVAALSVRLHLSPSRTLLLNVFLFCCMYVRSDWTRFRVGNVEPNWNGDGAAMVSSLTPHATHRPATQSPTQLPLPSPRLTWPIDSMAPLPRCLPHM